MCIYMSEINLFCLFFVFFMMSCDNRDLKHIAENVRQASRVATHRGSGVSDLYGVHGISNQDV